MDADLKNQLNILPTNRSNNKHTTFFRDHVKSDDTFLLAALKKHFIPIRCAVEGNKLLAGSSTVPVHTITWRDSQKDLANYTTITSSEQRSMYKEEYKFRYPEYKSLYLTVKVKLDTFRMMAENLQKLDPKSDKYLQRKEDMFRKYTTETENTEFKTAKLRLYLLQRKLAHIKMLISKYDLKCLEEEKKEDKKEDH